MNRKEERRDFAVEWGGGGNGEQQKRVMIKQEAKSTKKQHIIDSLQPT